MPYIGNQPGTGVRSRFIYTATASQTTFSGADDNSKTLKYADSAYVDVFLNGICLVPGTDYTASTKTSIVLTQAASLNDTLEVVAYDIASMSDMSASNGGTFQADVTFAAGADIITASAGTDNVRLGEDAGASIASGGNYNVVIGKDAGAALTTGDSNVAVGIDALYATTTSNHNVAIGKGSLGSNVTGEKNIAIGSASLDANTTGDQNVAVGNSALGSMNITNGSASYNTAVGADAGKSITTGVENTIVGALAGDALTTGEMTALGFRAGSSATTSVGNVLIGSIAGDLLTTGGNNTALGSQALANATTAADSVALGHDALRNCTASNNTAVGSNAMVSTTSGDANVAVGKDTLQAHTTGRFNTGCGYSALYSATTASFNTALGQAALTACTTGGTNIGVGTGAGSGITTGQGNICLGVEAGQNNVAVTDGVDNIFIGYQARANASDATRQHVLGKQVTCTGNDNFTFGHGATDSNIAFGATSITAPSDERYKEEIATSTAGLSFINDLRPVTFKWKKAKDVPSDHDAYIADGEEGCDDRVMLSTGETNHGFIAQEVKTAIDNHPEIKDGFGMWSEDYREDADGNQITDNRQRLAPSELIPILTKAIQELSAKVDTLETENKAIKARLDALEAG